MIDELCRRCKHFETLDGDEPCVNCCNYYDDCDATTTLLADLWESPASDNVNHPAHYNSGNIECIEAMQSAFGVLATKDFCLLSAFKYVWRCREKGKESEDIKKAVWYLKKYLDLGGADS